MPRHIRQRVRFERTQSVEVVFEVDGIATRNSIEKFLKLGATDRQSLDMLIKKGTAECKSSRWKAVSSKPAFPEPVTRPAKTKRRP